MFIKVDCIFLDSSKRSENTSMYFFLSIYLCYQTCAKNNILFSNMYLVNMNRQHKSANMLNGRWNFSLVARYFLFVARYFLLVACYFLLVARYFPQVTRYFLLVTRYFLLVARYFLLVARCSLLFTGCSTRNSEGFFLSRSKQKVLHVNLYK